MTDVGVNPLFIQGERKLNHKEIRETFIDFYKGTDRSFYRHNRSHSVDRT